LRAIDTFQPDAVILNDAAARDARQNIGARVGLRCRCRAQSGAYQCQNGKLVCHAFAPVQPGPAWYRLSPPHEVFATFRLKAMADEVSSPARSFRRADAVRFCCARLAISFLHLRWNCRSQRGVKTSFAAVALPLSPRTLCLFCLGFCLSEDLKSRSIRILCSATMNVSFGVSKKLQEFAFFCLIVFVISAKFEKLRRG
jgi:hypothetical protein